MNDTLEYIDHYFTGQLDDRQRIEFEKRCEHDNDFAREVSVYISMRAAVKESLNISKKKDFDSLYRERSVIQEEPIQESILPRSNKRVLPLMVYISGIAATLLIAAVVFFYNRDPDPQQIASTYISENLATLSVTMGAEQDSLALGINAYNDRDYKRAEIIFQSLSTRPSVQFESTKYLGLVYLQTESYDNALTHFDRLSKDQQAFANPGTFYKAVTLMKRSRNEDVTEAKKLLQTVVQNQMAGYKEAERWLEKMD